MSCLSGFKLYSLWVPLLLVSGCIYSFETIKKKKGLAKSHYLIQNQS